MDTVAQVSSAIVALLALFGALVALRLTSKQTRSLAEQTRIANSLAQTAELRAMLVHLHQVHEALLQYPALRQCVYGGGDGSGLAVDERNRLATVVGMLADVLELVLVSADRQGRNTETDSWRAYVQGLLSTCPQLREAKNVHPTWWPALARFPNPL